MQVVHERCAGLDVHKKSVFACVICLESNGSKHVEIRSFGTVTRELLKLQDWLRENHITHVAIPLAISHLANLGFPPRVTPLGHDHDEIVARHQRRVGGFLRP